MYIEKIFLYTFAEDIFVFFLLSRIYCQSTKMKYLYVSCTDAFLTCLISYFFSDTLIWNLVRIIIIPILFSERKTFYNYCSVLILLLSFSIIKKVLYTFIFSKYLVLYTIGIGIFLWVFVATVNHIGKERNKSKNIVTVFLSDGKIEKEFSAYFDSGNQVFAEKGEPVIIVEESVYNIFTGKEEDVFIKTVGGIDCLSAKDISIKTKTGKIYSAKMAKAKNQLDYQVILHGQMTEA